VVTHREHGHCSARVSNDSIGQRGVLVAGGVNGVSYDSDTTYLSSAELYNPTTGTWFSASSMSTARGRFGMVTLASGEALAVGGFNLYLGYMSTAELYNPFGNYDILHEIPGTRILRHAARDVQKRYIFADDGLDIRLGSSTK